MADLPRIPPPVARHAGLAMMQAASIASVLEEDELICPFAVITKGADRQSIEFEAETQEEAVAKGWSSLDEWRSEVDLWALVREGLESTPSGKMDVLVVAAWAPGMEEPIVFTQAYSRSPDGRFSLPGPVVLLGVEEAEIRGVADAFASGIDEHPKRYLWAEWKATPNNSLERSRER